MAVWGTQSWGEARQVSRQSAGDNGTRQKKEDEDVDYGARETQRDSRKV